MKISLHVVLCFSAPYFQNKTKQLGMLCFDSWQKQEETKTKNIHLASCMVQFMNPIFDTLFQFQLSFSAKLSSGSDYSLELDLAHEIVPEQCKSNVLSTKVGFSHVSQSNIRQKLMVNSKYYCKDLPWNLKTVQKCQMILIPPPNTGERPTSSHNIWRYMTVTNFGSSSLLKEGYF